MVPVQCKLIDKIRCILFKFYSNTFLYKYYFTMKYEVWRTHKIKPRREKKRSPITEESPSPITQNNNNYCYNVRLFSLVCVSDYYYYYLSDIASSIFLTAVQLLLLFWIRMKSQREKMISLHLFAILKNVNQNLGHIPN